MSNKTEGFTGCGCMLLILAFNLGLGGFSFDYCLWYIFEKNAPWFIDVICGLILAEFTVPIMIVIWLLKLCGVM